MIDQPRDPQLFALTGAAAREAIGVVRAVLDGEGHVLGYSEYPHLSWFDSGFPHLSTRRYPEVKEYSHAFRYQPGAKDSERVSFDELSSFQALQNYCLGNERIRNRFAHGRSSEPAREKLMKISSDLLARHVMERFLHLHGDAEATDELLLPIYLPLEAPVIADTLEFDILVPIVLTHFPEVETETIADDLSLRKLTEDEHLARWPTGTRTTESVNELVLSAATHAFVFAGHKVAGDDWAQRWTNAIEDLPWERIDLAFHALRVVTGVGTGYAQLVYQPRGWVDDYVAKLPPLIHGPLVRRYPEGFENWGWISQRPSIGRDKLAQVTETLMVLSDDPRLQLASRRFSESFLRRNEDDAVVDLCTCLEVLLTDESKTEVVHKLRLRAAAVVAAHWPGVDPEVVFDAVGVIYAFRSHLLHGSTSTKPARAKAKSEGLRTIKWGSSEERTLKIARWIAQSVLQWTVARGRLVPAPEIDRSLILDALTRSPTPPDEQDIS